MIFVVVRPQQFAVFANEEGVISIEERAENVCFPCKSANLSLLNPPHGFTPGLVNDLVVTLAQEGEAMSTMRRPLQLVRPASPGNDKLVIIVDHCHGGHPLGDHAAMAVNLLRAYATNVAG